MKYFVVTRVPPVTEGGNMAIDAAMSLRIETEQPGPGNDYRGRLDSAAQFLGPVLLALRGPVFRLGEVLVLRGDRDQFGRKPSKWQIGLESFDDADLAFERAFAVCLESDVDLVEAAVAGRPV